MSAHQGYGRLGADASSGGAFGEDDGYAFAEEGALKALGYCAGFDSGLVRGSIADKGRELSWGEVGDGEEVARREG